MTKIAPRAVLALVSMVFAVANAGAATQTVFGSKLSVKNPSVDATKRKVAGTGREGPGSPNTVVGDPVANGGSVRVIANGGTDSDQTFTLPAGGWSPISTVGFKYSNKNTGGAVKKASIKKTPSGVFQVKISVRGKDGAVAVVPPNPGDDGGFILTINGGDSYCVAFGGVAGGVESKDTAQTWQVKKATTETCPAPSGGGTTTTTLVTTTTLGGGTSSTTTTTSGGGSTTTTTNVPGCNCCDFTQLAFTTGAPDLGSATCPTTDGTVTGTAVDPAGATQCNLRSGGLYFGGAGVGTPIPAAVPDMGSSITDIVSCDSTTGAFVLGPATDLETGSNRNCTAAGVTNPEYPGKDGCLFGPPLPLPNTTTPGTSTCVVNRLTADASGSGSCGNGSLAVLNLPLGSDIYLTGDLLGDAGVQPCPLCTGPSGSETCKGGPNDGLSCTPGSGDLGDAYPTSHDCPPPGGIQFVGTLPIPFSLTTGTASKVSADLPAQARVFCGFCAQQFGTTFDGPPAIPCTSNAQCTNGLFNTCKQRSEGAFGVGDVRTITENGSPAGVCIDDGLEHDSRLVSVFCIPPAYNATVDSVGDLPGPGAVALPGASQLIGFVPPTTLPPGATTTTTTVTPTTTSTTLLPPCGGALFPACLGSCPMGSVCVPSLSMTCSCMTL